MCSTRKKYGHSFWNARRNWLFVRCRAIEYFKKAGYTVFYPRLHAVDVGIDGHHVLFELGLGDFVAFVDFLLAEVVQRELRLDFRMAGACDGFSCGGSVSMFISFHGMSYFGMF